MQNQEYSSFFKKNKNREILLKKLEKEVFSLKKELKITQKEL